MWQFLFYHAPWPLQVALMVAVAAGALYGLVLIFGWDRVRPYVVPVLGIIGALGAAAKFKQDGYADRKQQEQDALDRAEKKVDEIRTDTESKSDEETIRETDRWTRR